MSRSVNWGDVPAWLTMIATFLAVVAAVFAGIGASGLLSVERERDKKTDDREVRRQANLIAGWIEPEITLYGDSAFTAQVNARLSNPSEQPIYQITLSIFTNQAPLINWYYSTFPPKGELSVHLPEDQLISESRSINGVIFRSESLARENAQFIADKFTLEFSFRDSAGKEWLRDSTGKLEEKNSESKQVSSGHDRGTR